ncbi:MAG TPA: hypothetical protein VM260_20655 [Pirellula sp.]|nr:hypothetical protein [Pirellula sp.]
MNPNAAEIESIVRRVLSTLTSGASTLGNALTQPQVPQPLTLRLLDRVVSLQSLKNRLLDIQVLEIEKSAVLTPAARDYCNELKVEIVRGQSAASAKKEMVKTAEPVTTNPQRLLVAGTPSWMPSIAKQLCARQANVFESSVDDSAALRTIAGGLRAGHQAGIAIVGSPHAICWQAARDDRLRPAVVSCWPELEQVLREVPVNVLILSAKTWNVPSACNAARRFCQHLQNQS